MGDRAVPRRERGPGEGGRSHRADRAADAARRARAPDFGVRKDEYCSDLQRVWYLLGEGESGPPEDVVAAWNAIWASMDAGADVLRPGVQGHEVDAAARASLVAAGYEEPKYAFGHQVGRAVHDGGTSLAPLWDRYGDAPRGVIEEGNVFTLEYGAPVKGAATSGSRKTCGHRGRHRVAEHASARALARRLSERAFHGDGGRCSAFSRVG